MSAPIAMLDSMVLQILQPSLVPAKKEPLILVDKPMSRYMLTERLGYTRYESFCKHDTRNCCK